MMEKKQASKQAAAYVCLSLSWADAITIIGIENEIWRPRLLHSLYTNVLKAEINPSVLPLAMG